MKIALVHDYLVQYGGAERVLEAFTEIFPHASIYTIVHDEEAMHGMFANKRIHTSYLQKFPFARKKHRLFPFLMPIAIEQFDFSDYDVVLSDSSSYAKGIITKPGTLHICYMHTPMRYAWDDCQKYTRDFHMPSFIKRLVPFAMNYIRLWDKVSADRVDRIIANSNFVAKRIRKYYRKDSTVIHPPVSVNRFYAGKQQGDQPRVDEQSSLRVEAGYYLMVGRLIAYKKHDIAIEAFNKLGLPLKIIGRGPEIKRLQKLAGPNVEFLGRVADEDLPKYYADCKAFIFPQEEDFGIVAIEALASGRPLVAFDGGDIPEHMEDGKMGVFFERQSPEAIVEAVRKIQEMEFDSEYIRSRVLQFDKEIFKEKIKKYVEEALGEHRNKISNF
ncbi:MAG TPA: glycosyltransferase family 4 protein [Candidatus Moranbacteria bacterium]|nr:MAG: Glycosyl transferase group 1 [Candidatus Moranbacteria bacterium GW2011_GWC2_45_10]KKT94966.1 MAG: glycosyl transferase [Parcubacteria group bacterium GW2011_GWC1_45_14]HAV11779.1 glycosyltransferase family 4 protein [Candidatus Moranbacteria bacterium]